MKFAYVTGLPTRLLKRERKSYATAALAAAGALAATALLNHLLAKRAEHANPPEGKFVDVEGVRLHYVERGVGEPLILLHGNGSMVQDFETSGLMEMAAKCYRVIAFDRPGYGHSDRPRGTIWTANAQGELIRKAMGKLGVDRAIVLGHSWAPRWRSRLRYITPMPSAAWCWLRAITIRACDPTS